MVGQDHITTTLKRALKAGRISHAYLFTGPKGVGKTSVARILAHEVNKLIYKDDVHHLDIIEIDAASNRRIDEIRELRERVHTAPTSGAYKVYIIDEVHMLTKEAFNALLKTLEEPPAHVIFILATTEAHKLPETIVSRTQRFAFRPIDDVVVQSHLRQIAKAEKIPITEDALQLIAQHGAGSFRDSISLLDQAASIGDKVDKTMVESLLGVVSETAIASLAESLLAGRAIESVEQTTQLLTKATPAQMAQQLRNYLQTFVLSKPGNDPARIINLMRDLVAVPASHDPLATLHVVLLETALVTARRDSVAPTDTLKTPTSTPDVSLTEEMPIVESIEPTEPWPRILAEIKKNHATLYSVIRMAQADITDDHITLTFAFPFHQKRAMELKNDQIIRDVVKKIIGRELSLLYMADGQTSTKSKTQPTPATISTISNIFGDAEVLES